MPYYISSFLVITLRFKPEQRHKYPSPQSDFSAVQCEAPMPFAINITLSDIAVTIDTFPLSSRPGLGNSANLLLWTIPFRRFSCSFAQAVTN